MLKVLDLKTMDDSLEVPRGSSMKKDITIGCENYVIVYSAHKFHMFALKNKKRKNISCMAQ